VVAELHPADIARGGDVSCTECVCVDATSPPARDVTQRDLKL